MIRSFGVDVGGTTIKLGVFDERGKLLKKWSRATDKRENGKKIIPDIVEEIKKFSDANKVEVDRVAGIGLGIPGPVDENGYVSSCVNLGWRHFNPVEEFRQFFSTIRVVAENDANVAAFGEYYQGAGGQYNSMMLVTLGTGVGGGIIVDGHVWRGAHGIAGEIGHISAGNAEDVFCNCGNKGCIDQFASATGIVRVMKRILEEQKKPQEEEWCEITAKKICQLAQKDNLLAKKCLEICMGVLGRGLAVFSKAFDPEAFVIGGGVSDAGNMIVEIIENAYCENLFLTEKGADIRLAKLGNDAGIIGAGNMVL